VPQKSRTPKPPRPVQAPRRRDTPAKTGGSGLGSVPRWAWVAGVAIIAAIVVAVVAFGGGGGGGGDSGDLSVKAAMLAAGCTYQDKKPLPPKDKGNYHADVPKLTSPTKGLWNTFPPAAGGHYGAWAVWGFFTSPVNPRQVVHNEEHGAVVIWWGPKVPSSTVDQLEAFYNEKPDGMFGTPIAGLGDKIALTAWTGDPTRYYQVEKVKQPDGTTKDVGYYGIGHIATCPRFDEKAFATFRDAYRGKGPEGIPLSADAPGMGP
jgi:hypothetical protein